MGEATFGQARLDAYESLTIVVGFPKGAVPAPQPALIERWSLQRAFTLDWLRGARLNGRATGSFRANEQGVIQAKQ